VTSPDGGLIKDVASKLLACLTVQASAPTANPPKNFGFLPGNEIVEDMSAYNDLCCEGTAFVQLNSVYPSSSFPQPDDGTISCEPLAWGTIWTLGVMRCSPTGSINFTPTFGEWDVANNQHLIDDASLRAAILKYKEIYATGANDAGVLIGQTNALGPQGGCLLRTITATIQVFGCGVWEDMP